MTDYIVNNITIINWKSSLRYEFECFFTEKWQRKICVKDARAK